MKKNILCMLTALILIVSTSNLEAGWKRSGKPHRQSKAEKCGKLRNGGPYYADKSTCESKNRGYICSKCTTNSSGYSCDSPMAGTLGCWGISAD